VCAHHGMQPLTCSLIQLSAGRGWTTNLTKAKRMIRACPESDVIVLPEMFTLRANDKVQREAAEEITGPTIQQLAELARKRSCWIVAGSIIERSGAKRYNTCVVLDRKGKTVAVYRKLHLFDVQLDKDHAIQESRSFSAGSEPVMVNIEGWRCGLSICYDLRFPELYRYYAEYAAHILFVPANFTDKTGRAHWELLLRARAIENQCYVVAPNQCGKHPHLGVKSHGHSMVVGPWGAVMARAAYSEGITTGLLNPAEIEKVRRQLPALDHRRLN